MKYSKKGEGKLEKKTKNVLIKVSGDLSEHQKSLEFVKKKGKLNYVVVILGGGTVISQEMKFRKIGYKFGPLGRETNFEGRQVSRDVLERIQERIQSLFIQEKIHAVVEIPVIAIGGVLCSINGDDYLKLGYNTFDELYCITTMERAEDKNKLFKQYPKIRIIGMH
jgi:hypothetical protein